jgi:hypothetical protein
MTRILGILLGVIAAAWVWALAAVAFAVPGWTTRSNG